MTSDQSHNDAVNQQAAEQTGQRQVRLRIDEREMRTSYTNAYRTNTTSEEVVIDFGMNLMTPAQQGGQEGQGQSQGEILFKANDRIVMNYYTAKRLAMTMSQIVRQYEQRFGELKLNVNERAKQGG